MRERERERERGERERERERKRGKARESEGGGEREREERERERERARPSLHGQQCLVSGNKFKVGGGSHIVVSLECGEVPVGQLACGLVEFLAHFHTALLDGVVHLHIVQEPLGHNG